MTPIDKKGKYDDKKGGKFGKDRKDGKDGKGGDAKPVKKKVTKPKRNTNRKLTPKGQKKTRKQPLKNMKSEKK